MRAIPRAVAPVILISVAVAAITAGLFTLALMDVDDEKTGIGTQTRTITTSGEGVVTAAPDTAELTVGVSVTAVSAADAFADHNAKLTDVIDALKQAGATRIATESISISAIVDDTVPRDYHEEIEISGYSASGTVLVEVDDLDAVGELLDAAVAAGANQVYGPGLSIANTDQLYADALELALADARAKAERIATADGLELGEIMLIEEGYGSAPLPFSKRALSDETQEMPLEPGTQDVAASVRVTFELR